MGNGISFIDTSEVCLAKSAWNMRVQLGLIACVGYRADIVTHSSYRALQPQLSECYPALLSFVAEPRCSLTTADLIVSPQHDVVALREVCTPSNAPSLQVYGLGLSEEFLQDFMKETGTQPVIATKFAPLPWRFREQNVVEACK